MENTSSALEAIGEAVRQDDGHHSETGGRAAIPLSRRSQNSLGSNRWKLALGDLENTSSALEAIGDAVR
jgi:hypothetical protein